jgi:hypothetical protein
LRAPDVAEGPRNLPCFRVYPAWSISENIDSLVPKIFNWVASKVIHVFFRKAREVLIEVRVLFESETLFFVSETAEIPKNLCQIRIFAENLWHRIRY